MALDAGTIAILSILMIFMSAVFLWIFLRGFYTIQPNEQAVVIVFGQYRKTLGPGLNFVTPVAVVRRITMGQQSATLPPQQIVTRDYQPALAQLYLLYHVVDATKAGLSTPEYREATASAAANALAAVSAEWTLAEIMADRSVMNQRLTETARPPTVVWGVQLDLASLISVQPVGPPLPSMR